MHKLIGDKKTFAVEVELSNDKWENRTRLWLGNKGVGVWDDENVIAPFINSLDRIVNKTNSLFVENIQSLTCEELCLMIYPYENESDDRVDQSISSRSPNFEKYRFFWGENFDHSNLAAICDEDTCRFVWKDPNIIARGSKYYFCHSVRLETISVVYKELVKLISPFLSNHM